LNSRPLTPISSDPSEVDCLTPGHFLIGRPLIGLPVNISSESTPLPVRWRLVEQIYRHFWHRWSREYLHTLQQRAKWTRMSPNVKVGELFLIRDQNLPPSHWRMGRVIKTFPDSTGVVRVAELQCSSGKLKRPIVKLVPLPTSE
jgi:hypothetical protein